MARPSLPAPKEAAASGLCSRSAVVAAARAVLPPPRKPPPSPAVGHVLLVAEKPSVAKAIALALSNGRMRTRRNKEGYAPMCALHDFYCRFPPGGGLCAITVTSVIGQRRALSN